MSINKKTSFYFENWFFKCRQKTDSNRRGGWNQFFFDVFLQLKLHVIVHSLLFSLQKNDLRIEINDF